MTKREGAYSYFSSVILCQLTDYRAERSASPNGTNGEHFAG